MQNCDYVLTLRLSQPDWDALNQLAADRGYSRSEAARLALWEGVRIARTGHSFNVTRLILIMEYMQAAIDVIITSDYGDYVPELLQAAKDRLVMFHSG